MVKYGTRPAERPLPFCLLLCHAVLITSINLNFLRSVGSIYQEIISTFSTCIRLCCSVCDVAHRLLVMIR